MDAQPAPTVIDVDRIIASGGLRGVQLRVLVLCALSMLMEGFDTYGVGYVGPFLVREWGISQSYLGLIFTASVVSSLFGAVVVAPFSDRLGRRWLLIGASLLFGVASILSAQARTAEFLLATRVLTGIGLGAAVPNAFALVTEYAPGRLRAVLPMLMSVAIACGLMVSGLVSAFIIPVFGWRALLYIGGGLPLVWAVVMMATLPESIRFLALRRPESLQLPALLRRIAPAAVPAGRLQYRLDEPSLGGTPIAGLFTEGRANFTVLLWLILVATYATDFFLGYWLPSLLLHFGLALKGASLVTVVAKLGSIIGGVLIGPLGLRFGASRMLLLAYAAAALALVLVGAGAPILPLAVLAIIAASLLLDGGFAGTLGYMSAYFPTAMRATAVGWIIGFSRVLGGSLGPLLGGMLLGAGWSARLVALACAVPVALAAGAILLLRRAERAAAAQG